MYSYPLTNIDLYWIIKICMASEVFMTKEPTCITHSFYTDKKEDWAWR